MNLRGSWFHRGEHDAHPDRPNSQRKSGMPSLTTKVDYELAIQVVGKVVRAWDPYSLIAEGAPSDEFDSEIASLAGQIARIGGPTDAVHTVSRVFSSAFGPSEFGVAACREVGENLYEALVHSGLIEGPS